MPLLGVLDRNQVIAGPSHMTERADRFARILQQGFFEGGVSPRLGDNPRTVVWANFRFIGLNDGVQRGRLDISLFSQNCLQRADAQFSLGEFRMIVVVMMIVIVIGHGQL